MAASTYAVLFGNKSTMRGEVQNRRRIGHMLADTLFQPHHIVPEAELVAAAVKFAGNAVSQALVKGKAAFVQIFVRRLRTGKAGIHIQNMLHII